MASLASFWLRYCSYFTLGGLEALFGGISPPKFPGATGLVTNRRLFRKLYYQTIPGGTSAFSLLSSDYVLRSTLIALNNFIQYSHC